MCMLWPIIQYLRKNMPTKEDSLLTFRGQIMHKNLERVHHGIYEWGQYEYTSYLDDSNLGLFSLDYATTQNLYAYQMYFLIIRYEEMIWIIIFCYFLCRQNFLQSIIRF